MSDVNILFPKSISTVELFAVFIFLLISYSLLGSTLKVFPDAYVDYGSEGIRIMSGDTFIAQEYFMPDTHDESKAWEYASIACRVTQNFNRTHPLRMDLSAIESKIHRINSRKRRGRKNAR